MTEITAPTHCPSCEDKLVWVNHQLFCRNDLCPSKLSKSLEHFAKTLKIKGLGPSSIAKLQLECLNDLYQLSEEVIADRLNSVALAQKLYKEIENSKKAPLNLVLPAFGIPLIGKTATEKLSTVCDSIFEIDERVCQRAGLGPKATEHLLEWLLFEFSNYEDLPFSYDFEESKPVVTASKGVVCITGKLKSFKTKAEAETVLKAQGFTVKSSLTKDVTILVNESGIESSKTQKARDNNVSVITNLKEILGDL